MIFEIERMQDRVLAGLLLAVVRWQGGEVAIFDGYLSYNHFSLIRDYNISIYHSTDNTT